MLVVLTADHGVAPVPEVNQERRMPGGRLDGRALGEKISGALTSRFGPGKWMRATVSGMLYLDLDQISAAKLDPAEVQRVAAAAAMREPHIARVLTRDQLAGGRLQQDGISRAFSVGFFGPRSGDLFILAEPYYVFDAAGTTHGTPYDYDNH